MLSEPCAPYAGERRTREGLRARGLARAANKQDVTEFGSFSNFFCEYYGHFNHMAKPHGNVRYMPGALAAGDDRER